MARVSGGVRVGAVGEEQRDHRGEAEFGSEVQRRAAGVIDGVREGAVGEEEVRDVVRGGGVAVGGEGEGVVEGGVAGEVLVVDEVGDAGAALEDEAQIGGPLPGGGPVQWRALVDIGLEDGILGGGQDEGDHFLGTVGGGLVQGRGVGEGLDVGIRAAGEEELDGGETARLDGAVEGGLAVVVVGVAAHVDGEAGGEGVGDEAVVAVEGGPEECVHAIFVGEGEAAEERQEQVGEAQVDAEEGVDVARAGETGGDEEEELVGEVEERHGELVCGERYRESGRIGGAERAGLRGAVAAGTCGASRNRDNAI